MRGGSIICISEQILISAEGNYLARFSRVFLVHTHMHTYMHWDTDYELLPGGNGRRRAHTHTDTETQGGSSGCSGSGSGGSGGSREASERASGRADRCYFASGIGK